MSSSSPVPSIHAVTAAEDGDIVQENNGVMSLVNMTKSESRRSSLSSSSIEAVILNDAGEVEENADDDRVDQLLLDEASGRETQLAESLEKVATLTTERDAFATESRKLETQLAEERQKVATLTTERDTLAEKLCGRETQNAEDLKAESDALATESRDRDTKIEELNNEIQKLTKQLQKQTLQPLELDENSGQILFRIANFKAFSEGRGPKNVFSEPAEYINGLPWRINIVYKNEWIGLFLNCNGDKNNLAWNCRASFKLSVISSTKSDGYSKNLDNVFFGAGNTLGRSKFAKIKELMDPKKGFYDVEGDTMTFKAELIAKDLKGMAAIRTEHTLLVNGKVVHVNKYLLAAHSMFFQNLFFGANAEAVPKVLVENDEEGNVAHFERMISTMAPLNLELDDECVAGILLLANRFQLGFVVNRCVNFLLTKSKKSAIVKFHLAHECGIVGMKKKLLADMTKDDFAGENFMDNLSAKLDDQTRESRKREQNVQGKLDELSHQLEAARSREETLNAKLDDRMRESRQREQNMQRKLDELVRELNKLKEQQFEHEQRHLGYKYNSSGLILFRMPNFKAFSEGRGPEKIVYSPIEYINGFPWRIAIEYRDEWIALFLNCNADKNDMAWSCRAARQYSVVSRTKGEGCFKGELDNFFRFSAKCINSCWTVFSVKVLMDAQNGYYNAAEDAMVFKAMVVTKEPMGIPN